MKTHKIIKEKIFKINQVKKLAYMMMVSTIILHMEILKEKTEMNSPDVLFNGWFHSIVFRLGSEALRIRFCSRQQQCTFLRLATLSFIGE